MTQITDAMVGAARKEYYAYHGHVSSSGEGMRAALEAALAVAPDPAPDSEPRSCATCNGTGSLWNGGVESGRCPTCDGKGHDPAPDDAEFEAALDVLLLSADPSRIYRHYSKENSDNIKAARQRILALHRQAKHAGLRELRETLWMEQLKPSMSAVGSGYAAGVAAGVANGLWWAMGQIDAMLTEATDDR